MPFDVFLGELSQWFADVTESALSPLEVIVWPMNFTWDWRNFILSLFNFRRFSLHLSMSRMKFLS